MARRKIKIEGKVVGHSNCAGCGEGVGVNFDKEPWFSFSSPFYILRSSICRHLPMGDGAKLPASITYVEIYLCTMKLNS